MNKHLNDGQLRAALDGELSEAESRHLEVCLDCRERKRLVHAQVRHIGSPLAFLAPPSTLSQDTGPDARAALSRFQHRKLNQKETSMFKKLFASPALRYGLAAAFLLALIITVPTTRALADQLLSLFRVQQVAVVPIDFTGMQQLTGQGPIGQEMSRLLSNSVTITQKPGKPVDAVDAGQASQLAGFTVRLPQGMTASRISVMNASAFSFKIDRAKAQALLDEAGRSDLLLPDSIDGQDISVTIPAGVSAAYGTCPAPTEDETEREFDAGSPGRRYADCILLAQIPSPTVSAPENVDVSQLARVGLEFTGMDSEQAAAFTSSVDWSSTLVIPIPKNAATYRQLSVDGVTGTLIQRPSDDVPQFSLIWVKDGIIYAISGLGTNSETAIRMANSLP